MASGTDRTKRSSFSLTTIKESDDEDLNDIIVKTMRTPSRKKHKDQQSPSADKKETPKSASTRQRVQRHCAEQAREKISTILNNNDALSHKVVREEDSDSSEGGWLAPIVEEALPKGECK